MKDNKNNW